MENAEYVFLILPDLTDKPQSYLIYKQEDRSKPIAMIVFESPEDYEVFNLTERDFSNLEELNISLACEKFRHQKYFYKWD